MSPDEELVSLYSRLNKVDWRATFEAVFGNWCPYPDEAYARKVGWPVNADGTITTPGVGVVPSRELCEVYDLEKMFKLEDRRAKKRSVHVGFTGTKIGMHPNQRLELAEHLLYLKGLGFTHFHHGDCIGADTQAAKIAKQFGFFIVAHPGHPRDKNNTMYRAFTECNDEVREVKPFIQRDHDIVDETERMIATPAGCTEEIRSGTWTTVRYARKQSKEVHIIYPPEKRAA
jgi:hypothetical protein